MKRQIVIVGMVAVLGALAARGMAQTSSPAGSSTASADRSFAVSAAQDFMADATIGQLAVDQGSSQEVRAFGEHLVEDSGSTSGELAFWASQENIKLPTDMSKADQATYAELSKLKGAAFDRAYARDMVKEQQKDVADFEKEAKTGKIESIRSFAETTASAEEEHLKLAREMQDGVSQAH